MKMIRAFCFTRPGLAALLFFLLGVTIPEQAFALPELRSVSFSPLTNDDGTASCWKGRWSFRLGENPGGSKNWGYEVKRNGVYTHRFAPREREYRREALVELDSPVHPIAGVEQHVQFRTYDGEGNFGPWSEPLSYKYPRCDGLEHDGRGHTQLYTVLVGFADSDRDMPPFSPNDVAREFFASSHSGAAMTWPEFLQETFNGAVVDHSIVHPTWIYLPKSFDDYKNGDGDSIAERGLHVKGLRNREIHRTVVEALDREGVEIGGQRLLLVYGSELKEGGAWVSGGWAALGGWSLALNQKINLQYRPLFHELGHLFGLAHSSLIAKCGGRRVPSSFLVEPEDRDCTKNWEYGVGIMGEARAYGGFSGLDRVFLGLLDIEKDVEIVEPSQSPVVGLLDLDVPSDDKVFPRTVVFDREYLAKVLPPNIKLFAEYSRAESPIGEVGGVRIGLFWDQEFDRASSPSLTQYFRGRGTTMNQGSIYLPEAFLAQPGDVVELEGLRLRIRYLSENKDEALVQFEEYEPVCVGGDALFVVRDKYIEVAKGGGFNLRYQLDVSNADVSCGPSTYEVRAEVEVGDRTINKLDRIVVSSESTRGLEVTVPLGDVPKGSLAAVRLKARNSDEQLFSSVWSGQMEMNEISAEARLSDPDAVFAGQTMYALVTNTGTRAAIFKVEMSSVYPPNFQGEPVYTPELAPGKSVWVPLAKFDNPFVDHLADLEWRVSSETRVVFEDAMVIIVQATPASCRDGIQNGNESGVDCGGASKCAPCPGAPPVVAAPALGELGWASFLLLVMGFGAWSGVRRERFAALGSLTFKH